MMEFEWDFVKPTPCVGSCFSDDGSSLSHSQIQVIIVKEGSAHLMFCSYSCAMSYLVKRLNELIEDSEDKKNE